MSFFVYVLHEYVEYEWRSSLISDIVKKAKVAFDNNMFEVIYFHIGKS